MAFSRLTRSGRVSLNPSTSPSDHSQEKQIELPTLSFRDANIKMSIFHKNQPI
eukprot:c53805_g1_i1 orf=131-289(+)